MKMINTAKVSISTEVKMSDKIKSNTLYELEDFLNIPNGDAKISAKFGMTFRLKEFEILRYDIGIEIPCAVNAIDNSNDKLKEYLENRMISFIEKDLPKWRKD